MANGFNFTERVRKVLAMAREEAGRLHHEYVGTEHLLLALIREGEGIAATVLERLKVDPDKVRQLIEATVKQGRSNVSASSDLPYTSRAKKVLELAMNEAAVELHHEYVGTEHLLLGLLREEKGIAARVLTDAGLTVDRTRDEVRTVLGSGESPDEYRKPLVARMHNRVRDLIVSGERAAGAALTARAPAGQPVDHSLREPHSVPLNVDDGTTMEAFTIRPAAAGRKPGLMVFQEAFGVNAHIRDVAARFAAQGFVVIAPELYHRTGTHVEGSYDNFPALKPHFGALTTDGLAADVRAAYAWLAADAEVDIARTAAIGYCMGGRAAFLANLEVPLAAAASYYGGGIATQLLGRVNELHGPQLLCWGGKDANIPPEQTRAIDDALRAAAKPYTSVTFSEADHGFFCDQRRQYQPDAAAEAWALTIAFFARTTGIAPPRT